MIADVIYLVLARKMVVDVHRTYLLTYNTYLYCVLCVGEMEERGTAVDSWRMSESFISLTLTYMSFWSQYCSSGFH